MEYKTFREAMSKFATGITVVTTEYDNEILGMTVNAFMSISLEPKLIAVSIDESAAMYDILQETKTFGVSILKEEQAELSKVFAKQIDNKGDISYTTQHGIPVLKNSLAMLSCHVKDTFRAGDHMIFIAEVSEHKVSDGDPALYFNSKYQFINDSE